MLRETVLGLDTLSLSLCPNDEAVVSFWFRREGRRRDDLLRAMSRIAPIRVVGSRTPGPTPWCRPNLPSSGLSPAAGHPSD